MKTAVPSHAHDSVNAATIVLATITMPTEHQEGTRTRRSRGMAAAAEARKNEAAALKKKKKKKKKQAKMSDKKKDSFARGL